MSAVLDSSAILALVFGEIGSEAVEDLLEGAAVSAVNESEVVAVLIRRGATAEEALAVLATLDLASVALDSRLAADAGQMEAPTRSSGMSLGDRCCLALAQRLRRPALTADRSWAGAADAVSTEIRLIR